MKRGTLGQRASYPLAVTALGQRASCPLMRTGTFAAIAALCVATAPSPSWADASGTLLYSYDFDEVGENGLVLTGANKGSGTGVITLKQNGGGASAPYVAYGAQCSPYAFCSNNRGNSLWLGTSGTSLGCSTEKGFTISFWVKTTASHEAWSDFFGFRVGGYNYKLEYINDTTSQFMIHCHPQSGNTNSYNSDDTITQATAGQWKHVALVFRGTEPITFYLGGQPVTKMRLWQGGALNQIFVGQTLLRHGTTERCYPNNSSPTGTAIDNLDVYDAPLSAAQVKGLAASRRRTVPVLWHFDTTESRGIAPVNSGTATNTTYKWNANVTTKGDNDYANYDSGVLGSAKCFWLRKSNTKNSKYWASFRTDGGGADGLGATAGSGFSFSFWMKANADLPDWRSLFGFSLGPNNIRFAWGGDSNASLWSYGGVSTLIVPFADRTVDEWQHICAVWNRAESKVDVYCDGKKLSQFACNGSAVPTDAEAVKMLMFGAYVPDSNSYCNYYNADGSAYVDEFAFFNYSLSTNEVAWLGTRLPALPPLEATNIVRSVSASGAWCGGCASWSVNEWDEENEVWTTTTRTVPWPSFEDGHVSAAVAFANGVTIANDTFVTPRSLTLTAAGASPSSATLTCAEGSLFAPQALEIGDGLQLTVPLYAVNVGGTLTLGAGSKITFDVSNYDGGDAALVTDGIVLPAGESDALTHFDVTDNRFAVSLSADGKTVYAKLDNVAATAVWTGAGDGTSLGSAVNWECRNGSGTILPDALPCELTRVIVRGSTPLNVPEGTTIPWSYLRFEANDASLSQDCDWRGFGDVVVVPSGKTVDLNGHKLYINAFDGEGTFTSGVAGGELHIDVPEGATYENGPATLAGSLKLVKEGLGTLMITKEWHTYTGGTVVDGGVLKGGMTGDVARLDRGAIGASGSTITVNEEGTIDVNGQVSYHVYNIVLNGGTMKNGAAVTLSNWTQLANVSLADDSTFDLIYGYGLYGASSGATTLDLGGHTLTVNLASGQNFLLYHTTVKNGLVDITSGGWLVADKTAVVATNADFRINCALSINVPFSVRDYEAIYGGANNQGTSAMNVYGVFKPVATCYYGCTMQNGSTMDLREWPEDSGWPMYSRFTTGSTNITFAAGTAQSPSVVNVNLAGRTDLKTLAQSDNPYIVTWSARPENVSFVLDEQSRAAGYKIHSEAGGLRFKHSTGLMIIFK